MIKGVGAAFLVFAGLTSAAAAADLPRRAVLGAAIAPVPDEVRSALHVPAGRGVLVANILPGLSAEGAGLKTGDVLLTLDGKSVAAAPDVVAAVRAHKIGDAIGAEYLRGGASGSVQVILKGLPYE